MDDIKRVRVLGVPVDVVDMTTSLQCVEAMVKNDRTAQCILAVNPEKVMTLQDEPELKAFFEETALLIPDGIGVVLAVRALFGESIGRVPGADLMQNICKEAVEKNYKIFIYGSSEEVNASAVNKLQERHPGIQIVGRSNGYVKDEDMDALVSQINDSQADILFLALGSPRQENWIKKYGPELKVSICQGIGGTLDTIDGRVKRAPKVFQDLGLEWFYRLIKQPTRIKRNAVFPVYAMRVLWQKLNPPAQQ